MLHDDKDMLAEGTIVVLTVGITAIEDVIAVVRMLRTASKDEVRQYVPTGHFPSEDEVRALLAWLKEAGLAEPVEGACVL